VKKTCHTGEPDAHL